MRFRKIIAFCLFLLLFCHNSIGYAQCSMCRTGAESDLNEGGSSIAKGLNTGILYLMAMPYLILMIGGYFFFKKQIDAKLKALKGKYFPLKQGE
ncbi:MAG: hypothetical protein M3R27_10960 [Bacteroidota bacterium]|nr:hypothetical protein [Bacteroidota bacterium]